MAMLSTGRGNTAVVAVGEEIDKTGAILKEVYPDRIVVDRDGFAEEIEMKRKELKIDTELKDIPLTGDSISITGNFSGDASAGSHNAATRTERPRGKMGGLPLPRSLQIR